MKQRQQRLCLVSGIDYLFWDCIVYDDFFRMCNSS